MNQFTIMTNRTRTMVYTILLRIYARRLIYDYTRIKKKREVIL